MRVVFSKDVSSAIAFVVGPSIRLAARMRASFRRCVSDLVDDCKGGSITKIIERENEGEGKGEKNTSGGMM